MRLKDEVEIRTIAGSVGFIVLFLMFFFGLVEVMYNTDIIFGSFTNAFFAFVGLLILVTLSVYFYYKGKHYSFEKDEKVYFYLIVLVAIYSFAAYNFEDLLLIIIVGPLQFGIGKLVGKGR